MSYPKPLNDHSVKPCHSPIFVPDTMLDSNTSQMLVTAFHKIKDFNMKKLKNKSDFCGLCFSLQSVCIFLH